MASDTIQRRARLGVYISLLATLPSLGLSRGLRGSADGELGVPRDENELGVVSEVEEIEVNMDANDRDSIDRNALLQDVLQSDEYRRKSAAVWGEISDDLYRDHVLPYKVGTESPSDWRKSFHDRFWTEVQGMTKADAVKYLNQEVFKHLGVTYKKEYPGHKPDQNPFESQKLHFASCTGLSIILVCACRSVGIPARLAFTPAWVTGTEHEDGKNGLSEEDQNHTWVEVNLDNEWRYIGASENSEFDKTWFTEQASKAIRCTPEDSKHSIYAVSYKPTDKRLAAPWDPAKQINVVEVVDRYLSKNT